MKWKTARIGDVCQIISGTTPSTKIQTYWDGDLNWVTPGEIEENSKYIFSTQKKITEQAVKETNLRLLPIGTVLLSSRAPIGKVAIAATEMYCNQGFKNLICSKEVHNEFLFWFLRGKKDFLNFLGRGATFKEISKDIVAAIELPLPPLAEQRRIADILDKVDAIRRKRQQSLKLTDDLVKSQFIEMFGDPGTDPYGWGLTTLGSCCELNPRRPKNMPSDAEYSFVAMASVSEDGCVDTSILRPYTEVYKGFTYFAENDVLFAKITPCMENGKGGVATKLNNGIGFGSTEFHVLRPIKGISNPYWLYFITMFRQFRSDAEKVMTGTGGQRRVPITYLDEYKITLPPLELQNQFARFVEQADKSKFAMQSQLSEIEILSSALKQKFFA